MKKISENNISEDDLSGLCPAMQEILDQETSAGNEIERVDIGAWTEIDIAITLKRPFSSRYEIAGIVFYHNEDAHYPLTDSYAATNERQAIEAPY